MLATRHGAAGNVTRGGYVCWYCRLKSQQTRRYGDRGFDTRQQPQNDQEKAGSQEHRSSEIDAGRDVVLEKADNLTPGESSGASEKILSQRTGVVREHRGWTPLVRKENSSSDRRRTSAKDKHRLKIIKRGECDPRAPRVSKFSSSKGVDPPDNHVVDYGQDHEQPVRPTAAGGIDGALERQIDGHLQELDQLGAADRSPEKLDRVTSTDIHPTNNNQSTAFTSRSKPRLLKRTSVFDFTTSVDRPDPSSRKTFSSHPNSVLGRASLRMLDSSILAPEAVQTAHNYSRCYHSSARKGQEAATAAVSNHAPEPAMFPSQQVSAPENPNGIRAQLRQWQALHGSKDPMPEIPLNDDIPMGDEPVNNLTRLPDERAIRLQSQVEEDEKDYFAGWSNVGREGYDGSREDNRFLKMGDLVEIEFLKSERESVLAIYVRSIKANGMEAQFFTMQGRWMHLPEKTVQYSIPDWVDPELVRPLLDHLPQPEEVRDLKGLMDRAYVEDLSVPRNVGGPLVKRMVDFYNESQEIYRRHATALDSAHDILSHDTDLRYGSLTSAATTLLQIPSNELPVTALFTVRKALSNGGFAFNIDRRSHRLTGYMQIRSKEQVRMVEHVRNWIRQWQDDLAVTSAMNEEQRKRHKPGRGAQIIYGFLGKARAIVEKNRQNRQPTRHNNVGPSKVRLPITPDQDSVKVEAEERFNDNEQEIVRFFESWSCSHMFAGLPRIESLPPLILQALGLYDDLGAPSGFLFLQELGAIMPYENRIRFDQHLLLPSSQHSKPLQNLMGSLLAMKNNHNFVDSMAGLRHDWKDLPVFCIDMEDAHEIDDGVSVEPAGVGSDGRPLHWVHIHVANPTAFFSRDHPLAKMARHMGESIYMPERTYMMLPRWATQAHFSLAPGRPCMTFSAKLDEDGNTHEHKITPATIQNVIQLTPSEIDNLLGVDSVDQWPELILTVGGAVPPTPERKSKLFKVSTAGDHIDRLRTLRLLSEKRAAIRKKAGGVFFDSHRPEVSVWQAHNRTGLSWDHPFRKGIRTVEGDPVIQFKTRGLVNWFAPDNSIGHSLVQEFMLLAGETAAEWCAARQIPIIYRGTVKDPQRPDPERFWEEYVEPHVRDGKTMPLHLGVQYIQLIGYMVLRTTPKPHSFLGLQSYAKVTSPLRRYGDMIHHWQIEAALRHEAETGRSLIAPAGYKSDRSFLPFSAPVLDTIMLGLQPRESIITRSKAVADSFWINMLVFRKVVFGEDGHLPFLPDTHYNPNKEHPLSLVGPPKASAGTAANDLRPLRVFVHTSEESMEYYDSVHGVLMELNISVTMLKPQNFGLEEPRRGDVWEVYVDNIDVYKRATFVRPVRLIGREGAGIL